MRAVREAFSSGMTQAEIGREIGRSQPEVSRLLHFHGTGPRAMALRKHRKEVEHIMRQAGGRHLRVFGSVGTGTDHDGSDIDLLFTPTKPMSLMTQVRLQFALQDIVGFPVDLIPDTLLKPHMKERILAEAVPL